MKLFVVEPRDPLFVRDGRPMNVGGSRARSVSFPLPSTVAGLARTRIGLDENGTFTHPKPEQLLEEVSVSGPFLCRLSTSGEPEEVLLPAPRDVVWFVSDDAAGIRGHRLVPRQTESFGAGARTDLPETYALLGFEQQPSAAKATPGEAFWSFSEVAGWLTEPEAVLTPRGTSPLANERRTHVAIDPGKRTAAEGMLFSTEALRFGTRDARFGLLFGCEDRQDRRLPLGVANLGGERRISLLRDGSALAWPPSVPDAVFALKPGSTARVVLLSPAVFEQGALPESIAGARVLAAAVPRPEVVSGWDYAKQRPKPTRRMVARGSVYWVEVPHASWVAEVWLNSVCPSEQDRRDGFGIAVVGVA